MPDEAPFTHNFKFGENLDTYLIKEASVAIFFSWSTKRDELSQEKSLDSAISIANICKNLRIPAVLVSTISAGLKDPNSNYGKFKKLGEEKFLDEGQFVVRFGTIAVEGKYGGSALSEIKKFLPLTRKIHKILPEIPLPITNQESFYSYFEKIVNRKEVHHSVTVIDQVINLLNMKTFTGRKLKLRIPKGIVHILPINLSDKILSLRDVNEILRSNSV